MVDRITGFIGRSVSGLHEAALLLGISALASQLLALARDRIFAHQFGAGAVLDVYYAAFRIPDFLFTTIASLVSMTILIPFFSTYLARNDMAGARRFLSSIFSLFMLIMFVCAGAAFALAPRLTDILIPGFDPEATKEFVLLTRILLLQPIILGFVNLLAMIVQTLKVFFVYALTPLVYNIGIIFGALFLYPSMGMTGLAWGVVIGALMQMIVLLPTVIRHGLLPRLALKINTTEIRDVVTTTLPRTITLAVHQIVLLILTAFASSMAVGSIAVFNLSYNLQSVPLTIVGLSYSMAAFPTLAALFAKGKRDEFVDKIGTAARHIIFWAMPITALFVVLRAQIVRTILGTGAFDWTSTKLVAAALALFAISVVAQSLVLLFVRGYYAIGNTRKPLIANLSSSFLIIALVYILVPLLSNNESFKFFFESLFRVTGIAGTELLMLPLSYTIGMLVNVGIFYAMFKRDFPAFKARVSVTVRHSLYSAFAMATVSYFSLAVFDDVFNLETLPGIFLQGFVSGIFGIIVGVFLLKVLGNQELSDITNSLHAKFWKRTPIAPAPHDTEGV